MTRTTLSVAINEPQEKLPHDETNSKPNKLEYPIGATDDLVNKKSLNANADNFIPRNGKRVMIEEDVDSDDSD